MEFLFFLFIVSFGRFELRSSWYCSGLWVYVCGRLCSLFSSFLCAFVALLKNQQHPTYGLGKVCTTGGSDNTTRRTEENHRTGEMGGEWVRAAGWGGVVYSVALCSCGRMAPCLLTLGEAREVIVIRYGNS